MGPEEANLFFSHDNLWCLMTGNRRETPPPPNRSRYFFQNSYEFVQRTCLRIWHGMMMGILRNFQFRFPGNLTRTKKYNTKTPRKNRGRFWSIFGAKLGTIKPKLWGFLVLQLFCSLQKANSSGRMLLTAQLSTP